MKELRTDLLTLGFVESRGVEFAFAGLLPKARNPHCCHYICVHCAVYLRARMGEWKAKVRCTRYITNLFEVNASALPTLSTTTLRRAFTVFSHVPCSDLAIASDSLFKMLKRKRAASPSPLTQTPATEVPLISSVPTSSEHGVKRRKLHSPPLDGRPCGWGIPPVSSEDGVDEDDVMGDDSPNPWATASEASLSGAGEYKAVNSLLHDLHAEQQHRRLMSPSSHSSSSSPGSFSSHDWPSPVPLEPPAGKLNVMPSPCPNSIQDASLPEKYWQGLHASEPKNTLYCGDDVSVYNRYEESNRSAWFPLNISLSFSTALSLRFLGTVFLERRRDLSGSVGS